MIAVGALVGALVFGVAPVAGAAGAGQAPAAANPAIGGFVQALPNCDAVGPGVICTTAAAGGCFEKDANGGLHPATCPSDTTPTTSTDECRSVTGAPVPCDSGECAEGQCTNECYDAQGVRVPCDSGECAEGQCSNECYDAAGAKVDCDSGDCAEGQCVKECLDAAGAKVDCDGDQCAEGPCTKECLDAAGARVPCDSDECTAGKDCTPPTSTTPAGSTVISELGASGDDPGSGLAETGVAVLPYALGGGLLLLLGGGLALLGRRQAGPHHR